MKRLYLKSILFCLLSFFWQSSYAFYYDIEVNGIYYNLSWSDNEAYVTFESIIDTDTIGNRVPDENGAYDYVSPYSGWIEIPSYIVVYSHETYNYERYKVVGIGEHAFQNCTELTGISIPNSVTYIDESAFQNCI